MNNNYNFDPMTGAPIQQSVNDLQKKKKNNIFKFVVAGIVLCVVVGLLFLFLNKNDKNVNSLTVDYDLIFDVSKPIPVKNGDKYGYIDTDGKILLDFNYKAADTFYGDYAVVGVDNPDKTAYYDTVYEVIDRNGNVKMTSDSYVAPKYYEDAGVWVINNTMYDSKLNKLLDDGVDVKYLAYDYFQFINREKKESGIIKSNGKKVYTINESYISSSISENEYNQDDLYAEIRTSGDNGKEMVISLKTNDVLFTLDDADKYYLNAEKDGIFTYYNHEQDDGYENKKYLVFMNNKLVYQTTEKVSDVKFLDYKNQILKISYGYDYRELGKEYLFDYYDIKSGSMLSSEPDNSSSDSDLEKEKREKDYGYKEFMCSGKVGLKKDNKEVVSCDYYEIDYLNLNMFNYMKSKGQELVVLEKYDETILYDVKNSKTIESFDSLTYVTPTGNTTFIDLSKYDDNFTKTGVHVYNLITNKSMDYSGDVNVSLKVNYIIVDDGTKQTYYNMDFKEIYSVEKV